MTLLCGLALLCFALPWVVVSYPTARTEGLSGFELAFRMDAGINDFANPDDVREVEKMVNMLRNFAAIMSLIAAGTLVCAVLMALVPRRATGRIGLLLGAIAAHGYVAFLFATEPDAELQGGFCFAAAFAWLAAVWAALLAALTGNGQERSHSAAAGCLLLTLCLAVPVLMLVLGEALYWHYSLGGGELTFAAVTLVLVCVGAWFTSVWLTISEPTWKSGVSLLLSGIPPALLAGAFYHA
jgi:hypothetical protein